MTRAGDEAIIYFAGERLLALRDRGGRRSIRERSLPAVHRLNLLWRETRSLRLRVKEMTGAAAVEVVDGGPLLEILPGDAPGRTTGAAAREFARMLARVFCEGGRTMALEGDRA